MGTTARRRRDTEFLTTGRSVVRIADLALLRRYAPCPCDPAPLEHVMLDIEVQTADAWTRYGAHHATRGTDVPEVDRLAWGYWPAGPDEEILGDLTGLRVLDLGSGISKYAAHLARRGVQVDAVEASPSQHQRAVARYGGLPGLRLICADAVDHLKQTEPYHVIYSIHAVPYIDPHRLLPALTLALRPNGRLVFSALHTNSTGTGPSTAIAVRPEVLTLPGAEPMSVGMWVLTPQPLDVPPHRARPRRRSDRCPHRSRWRHPAVLHAYPGPPPLAPSTRTP
ncbi:bifunctional 2-polyprenyl-6-hydroxyphenol methylase/3-demethylubiquinol 3-O-methyltransferase UbiG [Streptomyces sp. Rer75]|uniref:class I SAM-dependent methyltransferase n=1 Tax=Streptomyces sp. Rer75 TaxID=2750011 RepID=UPI00211E0D5D|nr:class I SAM-dependent methyltransferase [Streptomyces sp. Rer75]